MKGAPPEGRASYPYAVTKLPRNWAAGAMRWPAVLTAATREEPFEAMGQELVLRRLDAATDPHDPFNRLPTL